jgi:hypothetical protein
MCDLSVQLIDVLIVLLQCLREKCVSLGALPPEGVNFFVETIKLSLLLAPDCLLFFDLPVDLTEPGGFEVKGDDLLNMGRYH